MSSQLHAATRIPICQLRVALYLVHEMVSQVPRRTANDCFNLSILIYWRHWGGGSREVEGGVAPSKSRVAFIANHNDPTDTAVGGGRSIHRLATLEIMTSIWSPHALHHSTSAVMQGDVARCDWADDLIKRRFIEEKPNGILRN